MLQRNMNSPRALAHLRVCSVNNKLSEVKPYQPDTNLTHINLEPRTRVHWSAQTEKINDAKRIDVADIPRFPGDVSTCAPSPSLQMSEGVGAQAPPSAVQVVEENVFWDIRSSRVEETGFRFAHLPSQVGHNRTACVEETGFRYSLMCYNST